jgi:hypothetical protein
MQACGDGQAPAPSVRPAFIKGPAIENLLQHPQSSRVSKIGDLKMKCPVPVTSDVQNLLGVAG